jgi:hypothetical protein
MVGQWDVQSIHLLSLLKLRDSLAYPRFKASADTILVAVFCLMIWLPSADTLFHLSRSTALFEKRAAAPFPKFQHGPTGLQAFINGLEAYFNDHFGWRNALIRWHAWLQVSVFRTEPPNRQVTLGKDGWLYYSETGKPFSPQKLQDFHNLIEYRRDWLARRGIHYLFVVAPNKQSIYPEHLPSGLQPSASDSVLDQFISYMRSHSNVTVLDLRPALRQAKQIAPTYFRTDSHWNFFGGFVASQEIAKALPKGLNNNPITLDLFRLTRAPANGQDLANLLAVYAEDEEVTLSPIAGLPLLVETGPRTNLLHTTYYTTNSSAIGSAIVFHDSFAKFLRPFLGYHFKIVVYCDGAADFDENLIEQIHPSLVISEIAERNLSADFARAMKQNEP